MLWSPPQGAITLHPYPRHSFCLLEKALGPGRRVPTLSKKARGRGKRAEIPKSPKSRNQEMKGCHFKLLSARMPRSHPDSALAPDAEIPMGISPPQAAPLTSLSSVLSTGSDTYRCAMNMHCTKPQKPQKPPAVRLGGGGPQRGHG